jgi:hypothetical protein
MCVLGTGLICLHNAVRIALCKRVPSQFFIQELVDINGNSVLDCL